MAVLYMPNALKKCSQVSMLDPAESFGGLSLALWLLTPDLGPTCCCCCWWTVSEWILSRFNLFSREVSGGTCMSVLNSHALCEHGIPAIVLLHDEGQGRVVLVQGAGQGLQQLGHKESHINKTASIS